MRILKKIWKICLAIFAEISEMFENCFIDGNSDKDYKTFTDSYKLRM